VGVPYLSGFANDGKVDLTGLINAISGTGGTVAKTQVSFMFALDSSPQTPKLNTFIDQNQDGFIDLQNEAVPIVNNYYRDDPSVLGVYASSVALPVLQDVAAKIKVPVLILQGENDVNIPASDAQLLLELLEKNGNTQTTLKLYPGLGHSLGKAESMIDDNFRSIEPQPIIDLAEWLKNH
jgi:uncharacterized protein